MQKIWVLIIAFMITPSLSGCLQPEDKRTVIEEPSIFDFGRPDPTNTWYHYAGNLARPYAVDATNSSALLDANITFNLTGNNIPYFTNATYYGTGFDTFEPTLGVTSSGAIFFTNATYYGTGFDTFEPTLGVTPSPAPL